MQTGMEVSARAQDNIRAAATDNARFIKPWRNLADRDDDEPRVQDDAVVIQKRASTGAYDVYSTPPRKSDFMIRISTVCNYLKHRVLPTCEGDMSGAYRVCYDDQIDERDDTNCLVFSKFTDQRLALMPDLYQMANYSNRGPFLADPVPFADKKPQTVFAGGSTGSSDVLQNARVRACLWSLAGNRDISRYMITNIVQITPDAFADALTIPIANQIAGPPIYINEQMQYQSVTSIDGNTAAWDRPVWIMGSRSILLKQTSDCVCWYYRFMKPGRHYVDIPTWDAVRPAVAFYAANPKQRFQMTEESRQLLTDYVDVPQGIAYTRTLLETACDLYKP